MQASGQLATHLDENRMMLELTRLLYHLLEEGFYRSDEVSAAATDANLWLSPLLHPLAVATDANLWLSQPMRTSGCRRCCNPPPAAAD